MLEIIKKSSLGIIPSVLIIAGFALVFAFLIDSNNDARHRQLESQTYGRFNSCALSTAPANRSKKDIDRCWREAMNDTGVKVKIYDTTYTK